MAAKVSYRLGTKETYLSLEKRYDNALYFCTDTKELFRGNDLYSDGVRIVQSRDELPEFNVAADNKLYFCEDNGCGYVLNATRDAWLQIVYGVDGETIWLGENGLISVKAVSIDKVYGLKEELQRIDAVSVGNSSALKNIAERLSSVEKAIVGGVHYRGAVDTVEDLPRDASEGDLYEVRSNASEWCFNGEKWFEYGKTLDLDLSCYVKRDEIQSIVNAVNNIVEYEISSKPEGAIVRYADKEIRVMCPANTKWALQQDIQNADGSSYYVGFRAYAPNNDVVGFKWCIGEIITDDTMYTFDDSNVAGIDEYGRKYNVVWLPVAKYDKTSNTWSYHGANSTAEKYIGWYYSVEWYSADGLKVFADTVRINLSNENCHTSVIPFYMADVKSAITTIEKSLTWENI